MSPPSPETDPRAFLGEEFLTWLWWRSETGEAEYELPGGIRVGVTLDDYLSLGGSAEETDQTLRRGLPSRSVEATAALCTGKRPTRARLILATPEGEWNFTLDGSRMDFLSVKLPEDEEDLDPQALNEWRMAGFDRLVELVDGIYRIFLEDRLSPSFRDRTLPRMRAWLQARRRALA